MSTTEQCPIVIIDSDQKSINNITDYIASRANCTRVVGAAPSFEAGLELIHAQKPQVVIVELNGNMDQTLQGMREILDVYPKISIFATSADKSSDTILKVMRAGAADYLPRPISNEDLEAALQKHGRSNTIVASGLQKKEGRVVTLFSPKGGVGVTTTAVNLASHISSSKKTTILVDLNLVGGDASVFLNLSPFYTITDATHNASRLDMNFLKGVIINHDSGLHVLAEPQKVQDAVSIMSGDIRKVLDLLKKMFDYIIIDVGTTLDERTMAAIKMSDLTIMMLIMSLPGIINAKRYLNYFGEMGLSREHIKLVVNRYLAKGEIKLDEAEKALEHPIFWSIPNDFGAVMSSLNKGVPLSIANHRSSVNSSIRELAKEVMDDKNFGGNNGR